MSKLIYNGLNNIFRIFGTDVSKKYEHKTFSTILCSRFHFNNRFTYILQQHRQFIGHSGCSRP